MVYKLTHPINTHLIPTNTLNSKPNTLHNLLIDLHRRHPRLKMKSIVLILALAVSGSLALPNLGLRGDITDLATDCGNNFSLGTFFLTSRKKGGGVFW